MAVKAWRYIREYFSGFILEFRNIVDIIDLFQYFAWNRGRFVPGITRHKPLKAQKNRRLALKTEV